GVKLHKSFARGELAEIVGPGAARVTAPCPHYVQDHCGGCQLQHVTYEAQLAAKQAIVGEALRRIAKLDVGDPEIVEAVEEWRYRAKISLAVKGGRGRARAVGFHPYDRPASVFDLKDCHIADFKLMALWRELKQRLDLLPPRLSRLTLQLDREGRRHVIAESSGEPWRNPAARSPASSAVHRGQGGRRTPHPARAQCGGGESPEGGPALERHPTAHGTTRQPTDLRLVRPGHAGPRPAPAERDLPRHGRAGIRSLPPDGACRDRGSNGGGVRERTRNAEVGTR